MKVLNKNLLIKERKEKVNSNGLDLTGIRSDENRYHLGEVFEVGVSVEYVKIGDSIYFDKHKNYQVTLKGVKYLVVNENDVVVIL